MPLNNARLHGDAADLDVPWPACAFAAQVKAEQPRQTYQSQQQDNATLVCSIAAICEQILSHRTEQGPRLWAYYNKGATASGV